MILTRRQLVGNALLAGGAIALGAAPSQALAEEILTPKPGTWSGGGVRTFGHSLVRSPKYGPDMAHFGYVNPEAPRAGTIRLYAQGRFDTFNPFNGAGDAAEGMGFVFDTLMTSSFDEGSTHYGLLAEWMERPEDDSWVAFRLRDEATFHDGTPVTVADVQKSFELLTTKGAPFYGFYYQDVEPPTDEGDRIVRFAFKTKGNRELPHIMGQLRVLPAAWWESRDFAKSSLESPLGNGPYRVSAFEAGRYVELERVAAYWGEALPVVVGKFNFDKIRFEYFADRDIGFEALKAGEVDYWEENTAKRWAQNYEFPAIARGAVVKREIALAGPKGVSGFCYNQRRARFQDRRVREALGMVFDFEWTNKAVYFGQYARPTSYFEGSPDLMATGAPGAEELALLEPHRDALPPELFEKPFEQPVTDGEGRLPRRTVRRAKKLLEDAGWRVERGELKNDAGEVFEMEILLVSDAFERTMRPWVQNLGLLGVRARFQTIDQASYIRRFRAFDFDCINHGVANSESPGNEQRDFWGSAARDREASRNLAGVADPVVDDLIEKIIFAENREALSAASRALDRVLLWSHHWTMRAYSPTERIAYWDRYAEPDPRPSRVIGFETTWWRDPSKPEEL